VWRQSLEGRGCHTEACTEAVDRDRRYATALVVASSTALVGGIVVTLAGVGPPPAPWLRGNEQMMVYGSVLVVTGAASLASCFTHLAYDLRDGAADSLVSLVVGAAGVGIGIPFTVVGARTPEQVWLREAALQIDGRGLTWTARF
jgi:hypothetical protein